MYFSQKIIPIVLLLSASLPAIAIADGYSDTYSDRVLDEAGARRALANAPDIDLKQVWFATGIEDYYRSPSCIVGRGIYVYTKPLLSSPGLWRGKESYYASDFKNTKCNVSSLSLHRESDISSFVDPDDMHPEEALDGEVPGLFKVSTGIPDAELFKLREDIAQLQGCLKKQIPCHYPIDLKWMGSKAHDYIPAIQPRYLTSAHRDKDKGPDCYGLEFAENVPFPGTILVNLCYTGEDIAKVEMTDAVTD